MNKLDSVLLAGTAMAVVATLLGGCSTIIDGADQPVLISTTGTEKARCEIEDQTGRMRYVDATPASVTVNRGEGPLTVECVKDGFQTATVSVPEEFNWWTVGNVIGLLGFGVDFYTGAYQQYPDRVNVPMLSLQAGGGGAATALEMPPDDMMVRPGATSSGSAALPLSMKVSPDGPVLSRHMPVFDEQTALTAEVPPPFPGTAIATPQNTLLASDLGAGVPGAGVPGAGPAATDPFATDQGPAREPMSSEPLAPADSGRAVTDDPFDLPPDQGSAPDLPMVPGLAPGLASPAMPAPPPQPPGGAFSVQVGAFRDGSNANRLVARLRPKGYDVAVVRDVDRRGLPWHYVRFGSFGSRAAALSEAKRFRNREGQSAFPVTN